jgi:hypothetical protein
MNHHQSAKPIAVVIVEIPSDVAIRLACSQYDTNAIYIDGSGLNTLHGGTGDDLYAVQSQTESIVEFAAEGADQVQTAC